MVPNSRPACRGSMESEIINTSSQKRVKNNLISARAQRKIDNTISVDPPKRKARNVKMGGFNKQVGSNLDDRADYNYAFSEAIIF
ncbi:hypothetical protein TNCV_2829951 [Trichonephila clavipes]|nr:hypothetical protein TNCV_2829951 [Trichonephila clavipes]